MESEKRIILDVDSSEALSANQTCSGNRPQMHIGYVRVSTFDPNPVCQLPGVTQTFTDHCSEKNTARPGLTRCLECVREGDTLHIHAMNHVARNVFDLQTLLEQLTNKRVNVVFHSENLTFYGTDSPMKTMLFQILSAVCQFERSLIRERQREGIAAAREKGVRLGAPRKLSRTQLEKLKRRAAFGEKAQKLAAEFGISLASVYRLIKSA